MSLQDSDRIPIEKTTTDQGIRDAFTFLPGLYELLSALENQNNTEEVSKIARGLAEKLNAASTLLDTIPGSDCTIEEQKSILQEKQEIFISKKYVYFTYLLLIFL